MLFLLPPSETKRSGGGALSIDQVALTFGGLNKAREAVLDPQPSEVWTPREAARYTLADMLKAQCEENFPEDIAGVWCDLLNAAVDKIAWDDIAEGLLDDISE
mgnify:CR=1 FL=1